MIVSMTDKPSWTAQAVPSRLTQRSLMTSLAPRVVPRDASARAESDTIAVGAEVAEADPAELVALSTTRIRCPRSAEVNL